MVLFVGSKKIFMPAGFSFTCRLVYVDLFFYDSFNFGFCSITHFKEIHA